MTGRSYAQIRWQGDRLGLLMVNTSREKFFIHAEKLDLMLAHGDEYVIIKERDRKPGRAIGYYPGMIMGSYAIQDGSYHVTLYVGEPYRDIGYDKKTGELTHWITVMEFELPCEEMTKYREVMALMTDQLETFDARLEEAEVTPRMQYNRPKRQTVQAS